MMLSQGIKCSSSQEEQPSGLSEESFRSSDVLSETIFPELKRLAESKMRRERPDHTLQPTALINELYLRLLRNPDFVWKDRNHFLLAASRAMRNLLIDHAREKRSEKRGGTLRLQVSEASAVVQQSPEYILDVDAALRRLAQAEPRMARVVELKFFGDLSFGEIGKALSIHERTAKRDWTLAKTWLKDNLRGPKSDERERMG